MIMNDRQHCFHRTELALWDWDSGVPSDKPAIDEQPFPAHVPQMDVPGIADNIRRDSVLCAGIGAG